MIRTVTAATALLCATVLPGCNETTAESRPAPAVSAAPAQAPRGELARADVLRVYEEMLKCHGLAEVTTRVGVNMNSQPGDRMAALGKRIGDEAVVVLAQAGKRLGYDADRIVRDRRIVFGDYSRSLNAIKDDRLFVERVGRDIDRCQKLLKVENV